MAKILIIDDDEMIQFSLTRMVEDMGHSVVSATNLTDGLHSANKEGFDLVFLDVSLPDGNGLDALPDIQHTTSSPLVIIITAVGEKDGAALSMRNNAWDYVQKPLSMTALRLSITRALRFRESTQETLSAMSLRRENIVGKSPQIQNCLNLLAHAAGSDIPVLITGKTGTGKELFARALHDNSTRRDGPFVIVDCAAIPPNLAESVLFGHKKGAFTNAHSDRKGLVPLAHNGTLFLDEIGELPMDAQRIFLRVLQERRFRPVGANQEESSNFRLAAATNRDLDDMIQNQQFREDLCFRLRGFSISLPALIDRGDDVYELATHFMQIITKQNKRDSLSFSQEFKAHLGLYDWPGNVRELYQIMERCVAVSGNSNSLLPAHLPGPVRAAIARKGLDYFDETKKRVTLSMPCFRDHKYSRLAHIEREYLEQLIEVSGGDLASAQDISNLSKSRLYALFKKHRLSLKLSH